MKVSLDSCFHHGLALSWISHLFPDTLQSCTAAFFLTGSFFQIRPLLFYLNYMLLLLPPTFPKRLLHKGLCIPKDLEGTWARGLRMGLESRYFKFHTWTVCLCNFHPLLPNLTPPVPPPYSLSGHDLFSNHVTCTYMCISVQPGESIWCCSYTYCLGLTTWYWTFTRGLVPGEDSISLSQLPVASGNITKDETERLEKPEDQDIRSKMVLSVCGRESASMKSKQYGCLNITRTRTTPMST